MARRKQWKQPRHERNLAGVQHQEVREIVDARFNALHDELEACYYGAWRQGKSKPFHGHDIQANPEESKLLFDRLHGMIFHLRELAFHRANLQEIPKARRVALTDYQTIHDAEGRAVDSRQALSKRHLRECLALGLDLRPALGMEDFDL
jgi:hypothetical protein